MITIEPELALLMVLVQSIGCYLAGLITMKFITVSVQTKIPRENRYEVH